MEEREKEARELISRATPWMEENDPSTIRALTYIEGAEKQAILVNGLKRIRDEIDQVLKQWGK